MPLYLVSPSQEHSKGEATGNTLLHRALLCIIDLLAGPYGHSTGTFDAILLEVQQRGCWQLGVTVRLH